MELLNTDDDGTLRRTPIDDLESYSMYDRLLDGYDNNVPVMQCNAGTAYCGCAAGDVCAVGLACVENLCLSPTYEDTTVAKGAGVDATTTTAAVVVEDEGGSSSAGVIVLSSGAILGATSSL